MDFVKSLAGAAGLMGLGQLESLASTLKSHEKRMPVLFIGHGSPVNGIETNMFSQRWKELGLSIPQPEAVICVSAHWLTKGTYITAMEAPKTIHDFGGFQKELNDVKYPAPGNPMLAQETAKLITSTHVGLDHDWGLDHGTWTVVRHMYPDAKIPVLQLSIDYHQSPQYHYELARQLKALRGKGVLVIGSGNIVHNLRMVDFNRMNEPGFGFDWAMEFDGKVRKNLLEWEHNAVINYQSLGESAKLAVPTPDHYYPLLYILGLTEKGEDIHFFNDVALAGSLTMTSVKFG